ncbi:MAG: hypothetical protein IPJ65_18745 [Archangiaceae bacterium]|nr:hypothetical protein [Archangiaceae bacterium]
MTALLALLLAAAPATQTLETPRFHLVYSERSEGAAKLLASEIEGRRDEIQRLLGRDWQGTTEVRLGFDREEFEAMALTPPPSWAVALAWPEQNVMLVEAKSLVKGDGQQTLRHELVHIALGRLGTRWPRWFHEGFAQKLTGERNFSIEHYTTLARAVSSDRIFKFDDLTAGFPDTASDVEIAYAQSAAFVEFLYDRHDRAAFGSLVDNLQRGDPFEIAFAKAFHTSLNLEERTFREQLPGKYPFWPIVTGGTSLWAFASLLVVVGFYRRRRAVARLRAAQEAEEAAEDAAARILAAEQEQAEAAELAAAAAAAQPLGEEPSTPNPVEKPTLH